MADLALVHGRLSLAETACQRGKQYARLQLLFIVTGQLGKLARLGALYRVRGQVGAQMEVKTKL